MTPLMVTVPLPLETTDTVTEHLPDERAESLPFTMEHTLDEVFETVSLKVPPEDALIPNFFATTDAVEDERLFRVGTLIKVRVGSELVFGVDTTVAGAIVVGAEVLGWVTAVFGTAVTLGPAVVVGADVVVGATYGTYRMRRQVPMELTFCT